MIGERSRADSMRPAAALVLAGLAASLGVRILCGPPTPTITIAWEGSGASARRYVERRFSLTDARDTGGGLWTYALRDTSEANRRAIVAEPQIRGVDGIDRRTFELSPLRPRAEWRSGAVRAPERIIAAIEIAGVVAAVAGLVGLFFPPAMSLALRRRTNAAILWLQRGIPSATPQAAAAFRMVFGSLVVLLLTRESIDSDSVGGLMVTEAQGLYGGIIRWLAAHPEVVNSLQPVLRWTGVLFVIGFATRLTFACFTIAALIWACVFSLNTTMHAIAALEIALLALLVSRWGDAWSVDALVRQRWRHTRAAAAASPIYGYTFWVPGFVLAVAFAAAAWSKVREGPAWILNGTVKYHFVSDLEAAWVTWGLWLTRWHLVAVTMAVSAVLIEALVITGMFSRRYAYRAVLGVGAAGLLVGFALFQGIVWLAWWTLLLSFLPWHLIGRQRAEARGAVAVTRLGIAQVLVILLIAGQQFLVTATHIEARPMFSTYDMYSTTYATPEEYEAKSNLVYRVVDVSDGRSADLPGCVVDDHVAAIARGALGGRAGDLALLKAAIAACVRDRPAVRRIALEGDRQVFVWGESRFAWKRRLDVIGPIDARDLRD